MRLYFGPLACSLATRIALYEAGAAADYTQVELKAKTLADGSSFYDVNPMGQVPVLAVDEGPLLTENTAVLQYVAARFPHAQLAPTDADGRARLQQWLGFIGTELHKAVYVPLLDSKAPDAVKAYSREKIPLRFGVLTNRLQDHEYLLDAFSIADAYLTTVLNWSGATNIDLKAWPVIHAWRERMLTRPSIARAYGEELALYKEETARRATA